MGVTVGDITGACTFDGSFALDCLAGFFVLVGMVVGVADGTGVLTGWGESVGAGVLVSVGCSPCSVGVNVIPMGILGPWAIAGSGKVMIMITSVINRIGVIFIFITRPCFFIYL